jgi:hypothetical protein
MYVCSDLRLALQEVSRPVRCALVYLWSSYIEDIRGQFTERCTPAGRAHRLYSDVLEKLLNRCKGYKDSSLSTCRSVLTTASPKPQPQLVR